MTTNVSNRKHWKHIATPATLQIHEEFRSRGYEVRVVGGAVRDMLHDKIPKDIDLCTNATPAQIVEVCQAADIKHILTGMQHGTITLMLEKVGYELTTLRVDTDTDGRHATVEFTTDFQLDAARRDLTINAMSVDMEGCLYDYFDGAAHLESKRVLFVGDPVERIKEDYLRILRYFRFYGRIAEDGCSWDDLTLAAISQNKDGLRQISRERIWLEISKIIVGNQASDILKKMKSLELFPLINLENDCDIDIERLHTQHKIACLSDLRPVSLLSYGFQTADNFSKLRKAWKMSSDEEYIGRFIIKHREEKDLKYFQDLLVDTPKHCRHKYHMALSELSLSRGDDTLSSTLSKWDVPECPIRGDQVIKHLSLPKGPLVQKYFTMGKTKWKDSHFTMESKELLDYLLQEYNKTRK